MSDEETRRFLKKFGLYNGGDSGRITDESKLRLAYTSLEANLSPEAYRDFCQMGADILEDKRRANRSENGEIPLSDENSLVPITWNDLSFIVDRELAENGARKTQDQWIETGNEQGKIVMCASHFYQVGKSGDEGLIQSIQKYRNYFVLGDRFIYNPDDLKGKMISPYGSTVITPVEKKLIIPVYFGVVLDEVLGAEQGLKFQQAFWDTQDGPEKMKNNLKRISGKDSNQSYVWTPNQENRKNYPERAARVVVSSGRLGLFCNGLLDDDGLARWVVLEENPVGRVENLGRNFY
tara:strand:+ start:244 stop:1122 length:879 start_codon:yes stop_codon:yes gene_type:complete